MRRLSRLARKQPLRQTGRATGRFEAGTKMCDLGGTGATPMKRDSRGPSKAKHKGRYEIILYLSQPDQAFIAEVPELPGGAAEGATYQQALANAEVIIQEWIETAKELGRPVPKPRGRLFHAYAEARPTPRFATPK